MPCIIRKQDGTMVGHCTNKPGDGNLLPDGTEEVHDVYEDDPADLRYDAAKVQEVAAFRAAQETKQNMPQTVAQKLSSVGLTIADLKAELAK